MIYILLTILILLIFAIILKKKDQKLLGNILLIISLVVIAFLGIRFYIDYQIGVDIKNQIEYQKAHNLDSI